MTKERLVTRFVKGPKPIWAPNKDGTHVAHEIGGRIMLSAKSALAKKRYLYTPAEFKAHNETIQANIQASQNEKEARKAPVEAEVEDTDTDTDKETEKEGGDS